MRLTRPGLLAALLAVIALVCSSCVPAAPDAAGWRTDAGRNVGDVAGEVATVEEVLRSESRGRFVGAYAAVTVVAAEESAGGAADALTSQQPPPSERSRAAHAADALDRATGLITDARIALRAGDPAACARYCERLHRTALSLQHLSDRLSRPAEGGR